MKHNKLKSIWTVVLLLIILFLFQQFVYAEDKSCLWKIETDSNTVYFLGSIHMLKKEYYPLKSAINNAYDDVQVLVFEVNIDSSQSPRIQQKIFMKAMAADGKTLKERLSSSIFQKAQKKMQELDSNISQFNMFKPWFFSVTLMALKIIKLGYDPAYGIDYYFFTRAGEDGKQVLSFETIDFQIDLFDELDSESQEDFLRQTLEEIDLLEGDLDNLIDSWTAGDAEMMEKMVLESFQNYPDIYDRFLKNRNRKWLGRIVKLLKGNKNCMVVVGSAHLLGKDGILSLLEERGYKVEQL